MNPNLSLIYGLQVIQDISKEPAYKKTNRENNDYLGVGSAMQHLQKLLYSYIYQINSIKTI